MMKTQCHPVSDTKAEADPVQTAKGSKKQQQERYKFKWPVRDLPNEDISPNELKQKKVF